MFIEPEVNNWCSTQQCWKTKSRLVFKCSILEAGIYSRFAMLLLQIYELLFQSTETICEWACYFGTSLSAIIAWRLFRMEKLTLINKMFLCYFCIDVVFSSIETYFLFKLYKERYVKMPINFNLKKNI